MDGVAARATNLLTPSVAEAAVRTNTKPMRVTPVLSVEMRKAAVAWRGRHSVSEQGLTVQSAWRGAILNAKSKAAARIREECEAKPSPKARKKQGTAAGGESEYEAGSEQDAELGKLFFEGKRRVVQLQWQVIHIYV